MRLLLRVGMVSVGMFIGSEAIAQTGWGAGSWQAIGASGTPDEFATSRVLLQDSGWVEIRPEIEATSVKLRYNIPPLEGLRGSAEVDYAAYQLRSFFRDNGPFARVLISIKSMGWSYGDVRTLAQFDSDMENPTPDSGERKYGDYLRDETGLVRYFRPFHNAYWAEVQLIKTGPSGKPGLKAVGVLIAP
jgi:hypothetical protein